MNEYRGTIHRAVAILAETISNRPLYVELLNKLYQRTDVTTMDVIVGIKDNDIGPTVIGLRKLYTVAELDDRVVSATQAKFLHDQFTAKDVLDKLTARFLFKVADDSDDWLERLTHLVVKTALLPKTNKLTKQQVATIEKLIVDNPFYLTLLLMEHV